MCSHVAVADVADVARCLGFFSRMRAHTCVRRTEKFRYIRYIRYTSRVRPGA